MKKLLLALLALALVACGKRGDPHPPVPAIPKAASDLLVTQRGMKVILTWSYPTLTTSGRNLRDIRRVLVYRYVQELPAPPAGLQPKAVPSGDVAITQPQPLAMFAKIPSATPAQFSKLSQRIDSLEAASLPAASVGAKLEYSDTPAFHAAGGQPVRITYAVVTVGKSTRSDLSNLFSIVPLDVPVPPSNVATKTEPQGVVLSWTAPAATATGGDKPFITGYDVYRFAATETGDELGTPINPTPLTATTYTDVPAYGDYKYRVTAVASSGPPRIESDLSTIATATFKDLLPPPPPKSVSTLAETKSVRLVWDPVEAPDLLGYNVYRYQGSARLKLTPYPSTASYFSDISIELGIEYVYAITSVDKSGNESAETKSDNVLVPKTP